MWHARDECRAASLQLMYEMCDPEMCKGISASMYDSSSSSNSEDDMDIS